jgi:hypothetical protein
MVKPGGPLDAWASDRYVFVAQRNCPVGVSCHTRATRNGTRRYFTVNEMQYVRSKKPSLSW